MRKKGPIRRPCWQRGNSTCDTSELASLDWGNWFQDAGYIHVRRNDVDGETWHRVFPKRIRGRVCTRVAVTDGTVCWMHDKSTIRAAMNGGNR